jgi:hypothetical protein
MTNSSPESALSAEVHAAWDAWPAPRLGDLQILADEWGEKVSAAFAGVPPMQVDIGSAEFLQCAPLLDLPPAAAAAYLGTYLLSFLHGAALQRNTGLFHDIFTRAHLLACLSSEEFWRSRVVPQLSPQARATLLHFVNYLLQYQQAFAIPPEDAAAMRRYAAAVDSGGAGGVV